MHFTVTSLIALAAAIASVAQLTPEFSANAPLTNAKRFAAGLPPLPPKSRRSFPHGGSKADTARRAVTSPSVPISTNCNILVTDAGTELPLGYVPPVWASSGVFSQLQPSQTGSLEVKTTYTVESLGQLDLISTGTATAAYPYLGGSTLSESTSSANLGPGLSRYFWITGVAVGTPKGSVPTQASNARATFVSAPTLVESAIWKYSPVTKAISAQWVNPDESLPPTYLVYATGGRGLMITGDVSRLKTAIPSATEVTFTCVPALTAVLPS